MNESRGATENRIRILLVEDNQIDCRAIKRLVVQENLPYLLETAASRAEGCERLRQSTYDLVLLDYNLPDGTGLELLREVKGAPAIFITGSGDEEIAVQAIREGACDYLIKDVGGNYLKLLPSIIEKALAHKQAEQAMERLNRWHELILSSVAEGIYGLDEKGVIVFVNPAVERMTGFRADELVGLSADQSHLLLHPRKSDGTLFPREECPIFATFRDGSVHFGDDDVFWRKDGTFFPAEYSNTPIIENGRVAGAVVLFKDITERRKAEKEREKIDSELKRSNQDLQDFAFSASHDLQEPLRKFTSFSQRLQKKYADALGGEGKLYLERMQKATERMQRLINDLLLYSRISTQAKPFRLIKLEQVVAEVLNDLEPRLAETGGRVEVAELPAVDCDKFQIRQLFQNLIVNALKFHRSGVPPVVTLKSRQLDGGLWEITVKDNGIGFDEKYAERIFKPFERLHGQSEFEGSGIGLAICLKIVTLHRGSIAAAGVPQQGATFIVTLSEKQHPNE